MSARSPGPGLAVILSAALVVLPGCSTRQAPGTTASLDPGLGPALTVERFLQAANEKDWVMMANLFGTHGGPVQGSREDLELRMNAIALVLEHDDYQLGADTQVPGRTHPTRRVGVDLVKGVRTFEDVPFLVVESRDGRWLIEEIGLDKITSR